MKIAFFAFDRPGYHAGPIVNARRLLPELSARGHEPVGIFMYQDGGAPTVDYLRSRGIECRLRLQKGNTEERVRWFLSELAEINPDVFVPNLSVAAWYAARWAREAGIPTVAVMRGDDPFYWEMVSQFVNGDPAWAVSGLVTVSSDLAHRVEQLKPAHTKVTVIPSGVPSLAVANARIQPLRLCYLGRVEHAPKNVMIIAEVMCRVLKEIPTATAQFVGKGDALSDLHNYVTEQGLQNRIDFTGSVLPEQLSGQLAGSSITLFASDHEGTPGALMDAMAHGLVPVCTATPGGVQELVKPNETGLIVEKNVESFVTAIHKLTGNHELWKELSTNARNMILKNYSLANSADRWIAFCEELLQDAGPKKPIRPPLFLRLPAVLPAFQQQDNRYVGPWQKMRLFAHQKANGLKRRLGVLKAALR